MNHNTDFLKVSLLICSDTIRPEINAGGTPGPGTVNWPVKNKFFTFLLFILGRKKAVCVKVFAIPYAFPLYELYSFLKSSTQKGILNKTCFSNSWLVCSSNLLSKTLKFEMPFPNIVENYGPSICYLEKRRGYFVTWTQKLRIEALTGTQIHRFLEFQNHPTDLFMNQLIERTLVQRLEVSRLGKLLSLEQTFDYSRHINLCDGRRFIDLMTIGENDSYC